MADEESPLEINDSERAAIERRLLALYEQHDGLTATIVLADAEQADSPLHDKVFKLSDTEAALQYRLGLCRRIIRRFEYVVADANNVPHRTPVYTYVPNAARYLKTEEIARSQSQVRDAARRIYSQIAGLYERNRLVLGLYGDILQPVEIGLLQARDHLKKTIDESIEQAS